MLLYTGCTSNKISYIVPFQNACTCKRSKNKSENWTPELKQTPAQSKQRGMGSLAYLTSPALRSGDHIFSSPKYNQKPIDRCGRASIVHSDKPDTLPEHHGMDSKKHQILPLCLHQSNSRPNIQLLKKKIIIIKVDHSHKFHLFCCICDSSIA